MLSNAEILERVKKLQSETKVSVTKRPVPAARSCGEDWVMEGHRLAQTVAYGDLGTESPALITATYERQAEPVIELQLEGRRKAGLLLERRFGSEVAWRRSGAALARVSPTVFSGSG